MKSFCPFSLISALILSHFPAAVSLQRSDIIHLAQARPSGGKVLCWWQKPSLFCLLLPSFQTVLREFLHAATLVHTSTCTLFLNSCICHSAPCVCLEGKRRSTSLCWGQRSPANELASCCLSVCVCVLVSPSEVCSALVITTFTSVTVTQWAVRNLWLAPSAAPWSVQSGPVLSPPLRYLFHCPPTTVSMFLCNSTFLLLICLLGWRIKKKIHHLCSWTEPWGHKLQTNWKFYWHPPSKKKKKKTTHIHF